RTVCCEKGMEPILQRRIGRQQTLSFCSRKHHVKSVVVKRFEQIIQRLHLECLQRELIVRGHEYGDRYMFGANCREDIETIELRHLNVEEQQVRLEFVDETHGLRTASSFSDNHDVGIMLQQ